MINKKLIAANFIFRYVRRGEVLNLASIHGVDAEVLEFEIKEGSVILNGKLREINFPEGAIIGGVVRKGVGYIPMGSFEFKPKDRIIILSSPDCIRKVESFFK